MQRPPQEIATFFRPVLEALGFVGEVEVLVDGGGSLVFWIGKPSDRDQRMTIKIENLTEAA